MLYPVSPKWTMSWWTLSDVSFARAGTEFGAGAVSTPMSPKRLRVSSPFASGAGALVGPKTALQVTPSALTRYHVGRPRGAGKLAKCDARVEFPAHVPTG